MSILQIVTGTASAVSVNISSNLNSFLAEKRFDKGLTIGELKGRLELITGASSGTMKLEVFNEQDELICMLNNDKSLLGSYQVEDNYRIHVVDTERRAGEFDDVSKVEKFELSVDDYTKRDDTVKSFLMKNKLGKYDEGEMERIAQDKEAVENAEKAKAQTIKIGDRCEAKIQGEATRRGVVAYVGKTGFKSGWWIGIKYDEPVGKNDGSIGGKRYFNAAMKYGGFARPANVEVGNYPAVLDEDMDEI